MYGTWVLIVLILISSFPVIAVYIWFRLAKYPFSLTRFLFALLAGAAAFFPALILQEFLTLPASVHGRAALFYEIFIRVALSEELSRLFMLFIFFLLSSLIAKETPNKPVKDQDQPLDDNIVKKGTATGLIAGLGFAILESARFAASDLDTNLVLLRIFTAALHGACGSRIGAAAVMFRTNPIRALLRILTATVIHGVFNFLITIPGFPSIAAILIALSALTTTILVIRGGWDDESLPEGHNGS